MRIPLPHTLGSETLDARAHVKGEDHLDEVVISLRFLMVSHGFAMVFLELHASPRPSKPCFRATVKITSTTMSPCWI